LNGLVTISLVGSMSLRNKPKSKVIVDIRSEILRSIGKLNDRATIKQAVTELLKIIDSLTEQTISVFFVCDFVFELFF
jgi:hypothetical protein